MDFINRTIHDNFEDERRRHHYHIDYGYSKSYNEMAAEIMFNHVIFVIEKMYISSENK